MQLTLAFLEPPPPQPTLSDQLDAEARIEAVRILARIIARAIEVAERMEATDELHYKDRRFAPEPRCLRLSPAVLGRSSRAQSRVDPSPVCASRQGHRARLAGATSRRHRRRPWAFRLRRRPAQRLLAAHGGSRAWTC